MQDGQPATEPVSYKLVVLFVCIIIVVCGVFFYAYHRPPADPAQYLEPAFEPEHTIINGKGDYCNSNSDIPSMASTLQVRLSIRDGQDSPISVEWINFQGKHIHYATLNPGDIWSTPTYYGHRWAIVRGTTCLMILTAGSHDLQMDFVPASDPALHDGTEMH